MNENQKVEEIKKDNSRLQEENAMLQSALFLTETLSPNDEKGLHLFLSHTQPAAVRTFYRVQKPKSLNIDCETMYQKCAQLYRANKAMMHIVNGYVEQHRALTVHVEQLSRELKAAMRDIEACTLAEFPKSPVLSERVLDSGILSPRQHCDPGIEDITAWLTGGDSESYSVSKDLPENLLVEGEDALVHALLS